MLFPYVIFSRIFTSHKIQIFQKIFEAMFGLIEHKRKERKRKEREKRREGKKKKKDYFCCLV